MAAAISAPTFESSSTTAQAQAAKWCGISAAVAMAATIPLVWILTNPLSKIIFVRGSEHYGDWGYVFLVSLVLTAPATYALFFGTAGEVLKPRVSAAAHRTTMRVAAGGMVPYLVMATAAVYWTGGPQFPLMISAGLTVPIAMAVTIWVSAQTH